MSFDREQETDRRQTERVMRGERPLTDSTDNRINWLGHKIDDGTARLDKMMLRGATIKEMEKVRGAVKEHLRHYESIHGLHIETVDIHEGDGAYLYRFATNQASSSRLFSKRKSNK